METGKSWFHEIFTVFNFVDGCVGLVPRCTESNFRGYLISQMGVNLVNGHRLAKYAKLNPLRNIRRIRYGTTLIHTSFPAQLIHAQTKIPQLCVSSFSYSYYHYMYGRAMRSAPPPQKKKRKRKEQNKIKKPTMYGRAMRSAPPPPPPPPKKKKR